MTHNNSPATLSECEVEFPHEGGELHVITPLWFHLTYDHAEHQERDIKKHQSLQNLLGRAWELHYQECFYYGIRVLMSVHKLGCNGCWLNFPTNVEV